MSISIWLISTAEWRGVWWLSNKGCGVVDYVVSAQSLPHELRKTVRAARRLVGVLN